MAFAGGVGGPWPRVSQPLRRVLSLSLCGCIVLGAVTMWLAAQHGAALSRLSASQAELADNPLRSNLQWLGAAASGHVADAGLPGQLALRLALVRDELPGLSDAGAAEALASLLDRADLLARHQSDLSARHALRAVLRQLGQSPSGRAVAMPELRRLRRLQAVLFFVVLGLISYGGVLVFIMLRHNDLLLGAYERLRQLAATLQCAGDELAGANRRVSNANTALSQQNQRFMPR